MTRFHTRLIVVGAALVAVAVAWTLARVALGPLEAPQLGETEPTAVTLPIVLLMTLQFVVIGWLALAAAERWAPRVARFWQPVAWVLVALSLLPLVNPAIETPAKLGLGLLHLVVAAVVIPGLARAGRRTRAEVSPTPVA